MLTFKVTDRLNRTLFTASFQDSYLEFFAPHLTTHVVSQARVPAGEGNVGLNKEYIEVIDGDFIFLDHFTLLVKNLPQE